MLRVILIAITVLIVAFSVIYYPGKIHHSIKAIGKISPHREWVVTRNENGSLTAILFDNVQGTREFFIYTEFQRGDVVRFELHNSIVSGACVAEGDTIGWIDSSEIKRQLVRLYTELKTQKASFRIAKTGEKESLIEEAERRLAHAREQLDEQRKIVERQKKLFEKKIISEQDYEILLSTQKLYSINVQITEAQLQSIQTGEKQEEIEMISTLISGLDEEIDTLLARCDNYTITSPLYGIVYDTAYGDTLVCIGDTSTYVVKMPIKLSNRNYVNHRELKCFIEGSNIPLHGRILKLSNVVHVFNGEQVLLATARLEPTSKDLLVGNITRCSIICEPVTPREHIIRVVNSIFKK